MSNTMKEAIVHPDTSVSVVTSPIPTPGANEVLIKVAVSGSNPKDWKRPATQSISFNSGDDIAGTVVAVGEDVYEFEAGNRVVAMHVLGAPHGSFAEYAIAPAVTTARLPPRITFEEAAGVPLAALTAAMGLFVRLGLPMSWQGRQDGFLNKNEGVRQDRAGPLLVYGAGGAVGAYVIQLAKIAGIGPLVCVAGKSIPFVSNMLDFEKGDVVLDYRTDAKELVEGMKSAVAASGKPCLHAFDATAAHGSYEHLGSVLAESSMDKQGKDCKMTIVLPGLDLSNLPKGIEISETWVLDSHGAQTDFAAAMMRLLVKWMAEGRFKGHPVEVVPGGLAGVEKGLKGLREGTNSGVKYVFRIAETEGLMEG